MKAYPKPGPKKKTSKIKNSSTRLHDIKKPEDAYCRFCNEPDDGTCYFHHCEISYLKMKYGSGTAVKVNDNLTVWAHHKCGTRMSIQPILGENGVDRWFIADWENKWLMGIIESKLV